MKQVAVITRTKDRPVFLKRAMNSVAHQTFDDYVHVIVNDGGDAQEVERLVSSLSDEQRKRTKVFHRDEASGAPDTIFNESINRVESEYFVIHDDDDTWHPEFLARTVKHLEEHKDIAAAVVRTDKIIEEVVGDTITERKKEQWMPDVKVISLYRQCIDNQFTPIATLFRRSAYEAVGKFDDTLPVVGDWEFGIRLLQRYDADFIDPSFALANYHHRKSADNSFAAHSHRYYFNKVANKYLREEFEEGRLGPGYVISQTRYEQSYMARSVARLLPKTLANRIKRRVQ